MVKTPAGALFRVAASSAFAIAVYASQGALALRQSAASLRPTAKSFRLAMSRCALLALRLLRCRLGLREPGLLELRDTVYGRALLSSVLSGSDTRLVGN